MYFPMPASWVFNREYSSAAYALPVSSRAIEIKCEILSNRYSLIPLDSLRYSLCQTQEEYLPHAAYLPYSSVGKRWCILVQMIIFSFWLLPVFLWNQTVLRFVWK